MHDVRRVMDEVADARFVPWLARLAPFPTRHHDIDFLRRMTMIGISHMRCHEADTDLDITPYFESFRADDFRIGVPVQERLALRLGAWPYSPTELRLDDRKGIGHSANNTFPRSRVLQCYLQMTADGQPSRLHHSSLARRRL